MGIETILMSSLLGVQVLGGIQQARGAGKASEANRDAAVHQSAVEANKARMMELQARDSISRGQVEQTRHQLKTAQLKGSQRARFAAAGLDLTEGSAFNVLMDTEFLGKTDELTIADNAEREAWAYRESARTGMEASEFMRRRASAEDPQGAAFTSLLGSAGQVGASWYGMHKSGAFSSRPSSPLTSYGQDDYSSGYY